jgi:hypothetical protein
MMLEPNAVIVRACPKCGAPPHYRLRFCASRCVRVGAKHSDVSAFGDGPVEHLHLECHDCGYERIAECLDAQGAA